MPRSTTPDILMSEHSKTSDEIETILTQWGGDAITVTDNSHLHVGHEGAKSGGGHFAVRIIADAFNGQSRIQRHRQVHRELQQLWDQGKIHALEVEALTQEEAS